MPLYHPNCFKGTADTQSERSQALFNRFAGLCGGNGGAATNWQTGRDRTLKCVP